MADAPQPVDPASAAPVAPDAAPAPAPTPAQPERNVLDRNLPVEIPLPDGSSTMATLDELAQVYRDKRDAPQMDAEQLKQFELFNRAASGDIAAQKEFYDAHSPQVPQEQDPIQQKISELEREVREAREESQKAVAWSSQLGTLREQGQLGNMIKSNADHLPYLSKNPQGAQIVQNKVEQARRQAAQNSIVLENTPRMAEVVKHSLIEAEMELKRLVELYHPQAAAAPNPAVQVVDDQGQAGAQVGSGYQYRDGKIFDSQGNQLVQHPNGQMLPVSGAPVTPPSIGGAGGATSVRAGDKISGNRFSKGDLKSVMATRVREMDLGDQS